jgi:hypothetical protein
MPAPRTCRHCDARLPPSVRWCSQCLTPVVEYSPRPHVQAPIVEGNRVDRDPAGNWSRWDESATTMGPRGRLTATGAIVTWLVFGFFVEFMFTWICQFVLLMWVLKGVWAKGWSIPAAPRTTRVPLTPEERRSLVPRYSDWRNSSRRTKALLIGGFLLTGAFVSAWSSGDNTRQGIMAICLTIVIGVPVLYQVAKPL